MYFCIRNNIFRDMAEERRPFYEKPIKHLKECNTGEYVFIGDGNLCYVERCADGYYNLYYGGMMMGTNGDKVVYPVTISTADIMDRMRAYRDKWHNAHIMNAYFSRQLEDMLLQFMHVDPYCEDYREKWESFWGGLDKYYEEMLEHAKALHIV